MSIIPPPAADLIDRLSRYRDRLIASGRTGSAVVVDATIVEVRAQAAAEDRTGDWQAKGPDRRPPGC